MSEVSNSPLYENDDVLADLETALKEADSVDLRASIQDAIDERKATTREELYDHCD
jgi:citrate lyase beta subunit